jgi:subtilisin family serine protease
VIPAWADAFNADRLEPAGPALPTSITREWAFGDGRGAGARVAVIDSGIDTDHPAVGPIAGGAVIVSDRKAPGGVRATEGPHPDVYGHGTACAAIIRSLAPDAEILSVRVLGDRLTGRAAVFAAGVRWAIAAGATVINLSLSTDRAEYLPLFHHIADEAYYAGVSLVCAANNMEGNSYPSLFAAVFSVAAHLDQDPEHWDYNPRPPVEWGAPGIDLNVAWLGGSTVRTTGNSFAAPHMTGHLARLVAEHPHLTVFQQKTVLHALATNQATTVPADAPPG